MAYDKLVDSAQLDAGMTATADAIRGKTGGTDPIEWDVATGFKSAVQGIQAGGGGAVPEVGFVPTAWLTFEEGGNIGMVGRITECDFYGTILGDFFFGVSSNYAEQFTFLRKVVFKNTLTQIGIGAFMGCKKLNLHSIPASVRSIENNAFYGCKALTTLTFEGKPSSIHTNAFSRCTNLLTINVPWAEGEVSGAPWEATNATINYNYTGG